MSEFTFLFRGSDPTAQSPEEMQKSMQKWLAWFKELGECCWGRTGAGPDSG
jgi:hypothetical protein